MSLDNPDLILNIRVPKASEKDDARKGAVMKGSVGRKTRSAGMGNSNAAGKLSDDRSKTKKSIGSARGVWQGK